MNKHTTLTKEIHMPNHTDSQIVEYHDDGSWTTTTVVTDRPLTKAEQAKAWGVLGGLTLVTFSPVIVIIARDALERRREKKRLKIVPNPEQ